MSAPEAKRPRPTPWYLLRRRIVLVPAVLIGVVALGRWQSRSFFEETVRDVSRYPDILRAWRTSSSSPYVAHFPKTVPVNAKGVRFYFQPGALQGSTMLELRFCLPAAEFAVEQARAHSLSASFKRPPNLPGHGPHVNLLTDRGEEAPPSRVSYLIGASATLDSWGMTLDPNTGEVAYWAIDD